MDTPLAAARAERKVYTVSRLMQDAQQRLESGFGTLWLQGELSNLARPGSGHLYFTVKDSRSQIRCAMFKGRNRLMSFVPANGDAVLVRGKLGLYAARGDFQLIVEHMEPAGAGRLQAAFDALKRELDALGWFAQETKRALPPSPDTIGVVTSPTGAALRDVLHVLARRYPQGRVILYPTQTQGQQAAPEVVRALERASRRREVDLLLLVRGGGSLEDLQAFNERSVAEAIHACSIPLVSGVGHEVDVTIADLVADLRAPTPSAAAELAVPDGSALLVRLRSAHATLKRAQSRQLEAVAQRLRELAQRLEARHPERLLLERARHVDDLDERLTTRLQARLRSARERGTAFDARLQAQHPRRRLEALAGRIDALERRVASAVEKCLGRERRRADRATTGLRTESPANALAAAATRHAQLVARLEVGVERALQRRDAALEPLVRALGAVGPEAVMARGYAVLESGAGVITSTANAHPGLVIRARLADGRLVATVDAVEAGAVHAHDDLFPEVTTPHTDRT